MAAEAAYEIRPVRAEEWREVRDLRLLALQDEAAPMAFASTYAEEAAHGDEFWQSRAATSGSDAGPEADVRQFVAISPDGTWVGTVVVLVERAGTEDWEGAPIERDGGHVVGVYLRPDHRGRGLIDRLFDAALAWTQEIGLTRARLYVQADNARAQGCYRRQGFTETGRTFTGSIGKELEMAKPLEPSQLESRRSLR